uniref:INSM transcriptional repressor 2 n=1 Tax=Laticauda laticaudata TaxID=8630 RepID=A0A8C5WVF8_LATLA
MPRGFLVKRSRRPGGSYRMRPAGGLSALRLEEAPRLATPLPEAPQQPQQPPQPNSPAMAIWDAGGSDHVAPAAEEPRRCVPSSVSAESSPPGPALALAEKLPLIPRTPVPLPVPLPLPAAPLCPAIPLKRPPRAKATPAKKPKAVRKLSFADEVTTSPVLGLRIKAASEAGSEGIRVARPTLLGEFVCQLCKEPYADPLALAQHRCSRIVRVEYRCPECHKIFSCPANLASHRRWHKPRPTTSAAAAAASVATPGSGPVAPPGQLYFCPYCHKSFRRQAYLRKHLGTHQAGMELLLPLGQPEGSLNHGEQQIFSCKHCPSTFFSSPGLTRHINKCHPSENRQVLLLQMSVRPGC